MYPICIFSSSLVTLTMTLPFCQYRDPLACHVQSGQNCGRCLDLSTAGHSPAFRLSAFACLTQKSLSQAAVESFATIALVRCEGSVQYIISEVKHRDWKK